MNAPLTTFYPAFKPAAPPPARTTALVPTARPAPAAAPPVSRPAAPIGSRPASAARPAGRTDVPEPTLRLPAPKFRSTPADRAVAAAAGTVAPITLDELNALAELQTRVDRKYFVPAAVFQRLISELSRELRVLDMDGRRTFGYESVYFDTPQLTTYRAHLQRRRQRFKARTRTYTDSGLCMFEVKLTGARGETVKERIKHPSEQRDVLTPGALEHLDTALRRMYRQGMPPGMRSMLVTTYRRTTFVSRTGEVRLTCDVGLVCSNGRSKMADRGTHILVESKSAGQDGGPDRILRDLGVRPISVSKYCVGIAALHPGLPSNPWHDTLRRFFTPRVPA